MTALDVPFTRAQCAAWDRLWAVRAARVARDAWFYAGVGGWMVAATCLHMAVLGVTWLAVVVLVVSYGGTIALARVAADSTALAVAYRRSAREALA